MKKLIFSKRWAVPGISYSVLFSTPKLLQRTSKPQPDCTGLYIDAASALHGNVSRQILLYICIYGVGRHIRT